MAGTAIDERPRLDLRRTYPTTPQRVWQAWVDPEALKHWFTPHDDGELVLADLDVRVGGRFHIVMRGNGDTHDVSGVYREVDEPRRLVFTWAWKSTPERESVVSIELAPVAGGTEMHFRHEQFFDAEARDRHEGGWTSIFVRLDRYLGSD